MEELNLKKSASIIVATVIVFLGVGILFYFGPISFRTVSRKGSVYGTEMQLIKFKGRIDTSVEKEVLRGSRVKINYEIKGPRFLQVNRNFEVKITSAQMRLLPHKDLTSSFTETSEFPFALSITPSSGECPLEFRFQQPMGGEFPTVFDLKMEIPKSGSREDAGYISALEEEAPFKFQITEIGLKKYFEILKQNFEKGENLKVEEYLEKRKGFERERWLWAMRKYLKSRGFEMNKGLKLLEKALNGEEEVEGIPPLVAEKGLRLHFTQPFIQLVNRGDNFRTLKIKFSLKQENSEGEISKLQSVPKEQSPPLSPIYLSGNFYSYLGLHFSSSPFHELKFQTSGKKNLCYRIDWQSFNEKSSNKKISKIIRGKITDWVEVAPANITIQLWLSRASFVLALFAIPFSIGKLSTYINLVWRRITKK